MASEKQEGDPSTEADISDSIDELEDLIAETELPPKLEPEIPVLNDMVDPAEAITQSTSTVNEQLEDFPVKKLTELVNTVDQKLSKELDSLVEGLKGAIKDSIIDELKEELRKGADQIGSTPPEIDPPDKPSE